MDALWLSFVHDSDNVKGIVTIVKRILFIENYFRKTMPTFYIMIVNCISTRRHLNKYNVICSNQHRNAISSSCIDMIHRTISLMLCCANGSYRVVERRNTETKHNQWFLPRRNTDMSVALPCLFTMRPPTMISSMVLMLYMDVHYVIECGSDSNVIN